MMRSVKCSIAGCQEVYTTEQPVSATVKFMCKNHPREEQVKTHRIYDPVIDNADKEAKFQKHQFRLGRMDKSVISALIEIFGRGDKSKRGYRIISPSVRSDDVERLAGSGLRDRSEARISTDWAHDDNKVRELLFRSFENLETNQLQRRRASRWCTVICLYYRLRYTTSQIAKEMGLKESQIRRTLQSIKYATSGRRANGLGPIVGRKGRSRK